MRLIDLSHTLDSGISRFSPACPPPAVSAWLSHSQAAASGNYLDCTCEISEVRFVSSLGTYMDSPYHFYPEGDSIEALRLEQLVLPGVVVDCTHTAPRQGIGAEVLAGVDMAGKAVLFHTGWSHFWSQPAYHDFPFLTEAAAIALRDGGARLAGVTPTAHAHEDVELVSGLGEDQRLPDDHLQHVAGEVVVERPVIDGERPRAGPEVNPSRRGLPPSGPVVLQGLIAQRSLSCRA